MQTKNKPIIRVAQTAGFCFGVNRAIHMVHSLIEADRRVATLGPIIHNRQVVEELRQKGVSICDRVEETPADTMLVIRSHGVPPSTYQQLAQRNIPYTDATCPFVEKIHRIVADAAAKGLPVLIAGDPEHPEILGIKGFAGNRVYCYQNEEELQDLLKNNNFLHSSTFVNVCQTTFSKKHGKNAKKF